MTTTVTVVDYGVGNVLSVQRALEHCDAKVILAETPEQIKSASSLILPGVGAFANGMNELHSRNLIEPVKEYAASGKPLLGICLGMQMLVDESEEFGVTKGLGLIPGKVVPIPAQTSDGVRHKIPHIGWNELKYPSSLSMWEGTIFSELKGRPPVYFVHSFTVIPDSDTNRLADTCYDDSLISAAIYSDNIYGCQFHPEKSGLDGLKILQSFLSL